MNTPFVVAIIFLLISRLIYLFNDDAQELKECLTMCFIQIVGLTLFRLGINWFLLLMVWMGLNALFFCWENRSQRINELRLLSLALNLILLSLFFSDRIHLTFNDGVLALLSGLKHYSQLWAFMQTINAENAGLIILGLLFIINEVNLMIRSTFSIFDLVPKMNTEAQQVDRQEYNAGRVIGILERIIIFIVVLYNQFSVIGFILAAKGITRFRELEKRKFAEYVLIGTLLSSMLALLSALMVRAHL
ncbi:MAG: hypothetical protein GF313_03990 [Caldithrix sp.]|nr:hypothetical protein [Caldithrix sp.]